MSIFGYPDLVISLDDETPALKDISAFVTEFSGWNLEQVLEEITAAGDADDRHAPVGLTVKEAVTLAGPFDDVADGLFDVCETTPGAIRTLQLKFDGSTAINVECYIKNRNRRAARGGLQMYEVVLQPTGAIT